MEALGFILAHNVTRAHVLSAQPNAPTILEPPPRQRHVPGPTRRAAAGALRRLADRLEPCRPIAA